MPDYHNDHQAWFVQSWGDGSVQIRSKATGNCLDDSFEARLQLPVQREGVPGLVRDSLG